FGDDEADAVLIVQTADVPRWSLREQLVQEKISLGIYLGGHPYQEYADELSNFIKLKLSDLTPQLVGKSNGGGYGGGQGKSRGVAVLIAGIVAAIRIQQTRRGRMAVITLDDGAGQTELTVFNEIYEANRPWIIEDELLVVRGKATLDEYSIRVSGEELFDLAQARSNFAQQLSLRCDGFVTIAQLKNVLTPYREGKCTVQLYYRTPAAACQLRLNESWQVTLSNELLRDLHGLLQIENVQVVYG
ncbi:MAG: DNA-directed polymerase, partial [Pseudomonadota bacterium]